MEWDFLKKIAGYKPEIFLKILSVFINFQKSSRSLLKQLFWWSDLVECFCCVSNHLPLMFTNHMQYKHFNLKWSCRSTFVGISTLISSPMFITFFLDPKAANVFCFHLGILNSNIGSKLTCHIILTLSRCALFLNSWFSVRGYWLLTSSSP